VKNPRGKALLFRKDKTILLSSTSPTGKFDLSPSGRFDGSITSVRLAAESSHATIYYRDGTIGTHRLVAKGKNTLVWKTDSQQIKIGSPHGGQEHRPVRKP
jgi:hypothetical protein